MWSGVHLEVAAGSLLDFGMYTVLKIVRGRRYLYEQRTWREGKRVRTESHYLGPLDGGMRRSKKTSMLGKVGEFIQRQGPLFSALDRYEELAAKQALEQEQKTIEARDAAMATMHDLYGMKAPVIDDRGAVVPAASQAVKGGATGEESPADTSDGQSAPDAASK